MGKYKDLLEEPKKRHEYWARVARMEFSEGILGLMMEDGVLRSELAKRLGCSPPNVTKLLEARNPQLITMNRVAGALDAAVHVMVVRRDEWLHVDTVSKCRDGDIQWPLPTLR